MGHLCSRRAEPGAHSPPSWTQTEPSKTVDDHRQEATHLLAERASPAAASSSQAAAESITRAEPNIKAASPACAKPEAAVRNSPSEGQTPVATASAAAPTDKKQFTSESSKPIGSMAASQQPPVAPPVTKPPGGYGGAVASKVSTKGADCLELLQDEVEHALKQCTIEKLQRVKELKGSSVMLGNFVVQGTARLHKKTCTFQVGVTFSWELMEQFGGSLGFKGSVEIADFTHNDKAPKIVVNGPRGVRDREKFRYAIEWMKEQGASIIAGYLDGPELATAVVNEASDDDEEDAQEPATSAQPAVPEAKPQVGDMTAWAEEWLTGRLCALTLNLFGGLIVAKISSCQVSGHASRSSSSDGPRTSYELRLECTWSATASNGGPGGGEGSLIVPEFSPEKGFAKCEVLVEKAPGKKTSGQTVTAFRQQGVDAVRTTLEQFAHELNAF